MNLKVILEPSDEGGFTAIVPSLPGCISEGDTREEALANIREAIELYLEPMIFSFITTTSFGRWHSAGWIDRCGCIPRPQ
jgi:predicted RNase H-like HicB family nuclease